MSNYIDPARISAFRQYVLARAHSFDGIAAMKENFVVANFDEFCTSELELLVGKCAITKVDAGATVKRLARQWKTIQPPPPLLPPPTLNETAPLMHGWQRLDGKIVTSPITANVASTVYGVVVDIFFRDVSTLCHNRWKAASWSEWKSAGEVKAVSQHSVVQYSKSSLSIYALEANGKCREMYFDLNGGSWLPDAHLAGCLDKYLNGTIISAPSASSNFTGNPSAPRIDLFSLGSNSECMQSCYTSEWSGWKSLGGVMMSQPVAVWTTEPHQLHVFGLNPDRNVYHKQWDGISWTSWENLGGRFISKPSVVVQGSNCIHLFAVCTDHSTWHRWWNGTSWTTSWEHLTEKSVSIQGICVDDNRLDIFVVGTDSVCRRRRRNGVSWTDWQHISGLFVSEVSAVFIPAPHNKILLLGVGSDSHCWYKVVE